MPTHHQPARAALIPVPIHPLSPSSPTTIKSVRRKGCCLSVEHSFPDSKNQLCVGLPGLRTPMTQGHDPRAQCYSRYIIHLASISRILPTYSAVTPIESPPPLAIPQHPVGSRKPQIKSLRPQNSYSILSDQSIPVHIKKARPIAESRLLIMSFRITYSGA